jgi:hypothetical protein
VIAVCALAVRPLSLPPLQDPPPPLFFGCGRLPELGLSLRIYFIHSFIRRSVEEEQAVTVAIFVSCLNTKNRDQITGRAISPRQYRFPSAHRSQAGSSLVSTTVGDHVGIPGALLFVLSFQILPFLFSRDLLFFNHSESLTIFKMFKKY